MNTNSLNPTTTVVTSQPDLSKPVGPKYFSAATKKTLAVASFVFSSSTATALYLKLASNLKVVATIIGLTALAAAIAYRFFSKAAPAKKLELLKIEEKVTSQASETEKKDQLPPVVKKDESTGKITVEDSETITEYVKVDGKPQGDAKLTYKATGVSIEFTYEKGVPQGLAIQTNPDKSRIIFTYKDGVEQGEARETSADGHEISFQFVNGKKEGQATFKNINEESDESTVEFCYKNDVPEGKATETHKDGTKIEFIYENGIRTDLKTTLPELVEEQQPAAKPEAQKAVEQPAPQTLTIGTLEMVSVEKKEIVSEEKK